MKRKHTGQSGRYGLVSKFAKGINGFASGVKGAARIYKKYRQVKKKWDKPKKPHKSNDKDSTKKPIIESTAFPDKIVSVKTVYKPMKMARSTKLIANNANYVNIATSKNSSTWNTQASTEWANIWSSSDIGGYFDNAAKFWNSTIAQEVAINHGTNHRTDYKFLLSSLKTELRITNEEPILAELDIYFLLSKKTAMTIATPTTDWDSDINAQSGSNPLLSRDQPYARPNGGPNFARNWSIVKQYRTVLGAGCTHNAEWLFKPNRIVDMEYVNRNAMIKGITGYIMVVQRGFVVDSSLADTVGNISLSKTKLIGCVTQTVRTRLVSVFPGTYKYVNNFAAVGGVEYGMNVDTGVVIDLIANAVVASTQA